MKKTITILLTTFSTVLSFGQSDRTMMYADWKTGTEKTIYGNKIFRHEGNNDMSGITNVGYQTFTQVRADVETRAEKDMWTPEKKQQTLTAMDMVGGGGRIYLYIERLTIGAANTDMFSVIVRDSTDTNEIFRKDLMSDIPEVPSSGSDYWWNSTVISVPKKVSGKIFIYIIDRLGGDNNKFKFSVTI